MLSAGTQSAFSSNWKPAFVGSKRTQSRTEITNVTTEVTSAALLQLRSTASLGPLTARQNSAPTSGRNVTSERIGQLDIGLPRRRQHEPGDERHHANQHYKGIVIDITALEAAEYARHVLRSCREVVGPEPVNQCAVTLLPEGPADA